MAERGMPHVVPEPDRLDEVLVQAQSPGDSAGDRGRLQRVRHPRAVVIAGRIDEHLRLSLEAPERLGVQDAIAVALERRAQAAIILRTQSSARVVRAHGEGREAALLVLADLRL